MCTVQIRSPCPNGHARELEKCWLVRPPPCLSRPTQTRPSHSPHKWPWLSTSVSVWTGRALGAWRMKLVRCDSAGSCSRAGWLCGSRCQTHHVLGMSARITLLLNHYACLSWHVVTTSIRQPHGVTFCYYLRHRQFVVRPQLPITGQLLTTS